MMEPNITWTRGTPAMIPRIPGMLEQIALAAAAPGCFHAQPSNRRSMSEETRAKIFLRSKLGKMWDAMEEDTPYSQQEMYALAPGTEKKHVRSNLCMLRQRGLVRKEGAALKPIYYKAFGEFEGGES